MLYLSPKPVLTSRPVLPKIVASYLSSTIKICEILCFLLLLKYLHNILSLNYLLYGTWQKSLLTLLWRSACWCWGEQVPGCRGSRVRPCQTLFSEQWGARYRLRHQLLLACCFQIYIVFLTVISSTFLFIQILLTLLPQKSEKPKWIKLLNETAWNRISWNSLAVQWLVLCFKALTRVQVSPLVLGAKIPQTALCDQK